MGLGDLRAIDNPKPFRKGDNGRKGRRYVPPNLKVFNDRMRYNSGLRMKPSTVKTAFEYLLGLPIHRLREIAGDPNDPDNKYPAIMRVAAAEILREGLPAVLAILKQIHGQAAYLRVETTTNIQFLNLDETAIAQLHQTLEQIAARGEQASASNADSDGIEHIIIE